VRSEVKTEALVSSSAKIIGDYALNMQENTDPYNRGIMDTNRPLKTTKRLSLYGMKPEDALKKALSTAPPAKPAKKQPKKG
jgi:hypothetical protein